MAEEDDEENTAGEEPPKKKGKMMLIIIIAVVLLLGGGGAAFFLLGGEPEKPEGEEEEEIDFSYQTVQMRPFIVNLSGNEGYLKITLLLEYDPALIQTDSTKKSLGGGANNPLSGDLPGVLNDREAMIRDAILLNLSSKTRDLLLTPEGKENLKEELVEAINDATLLDDPPVVAVYFLEFVIQ